MCQLRIAPFIVGRERFFAKIYPREALGFLWLYKGKTFDYLSTRVYISTTQCSQCPVIKFFSKETTVFLNQYFGILGHLHKNAYLFFFFSSSSFDYMSFLSEMMSAFYLRKPPY